MDKYIELAKKTIEEYIRNGKILETPVGLPDEFYSRKSGVFVTIFKNGELSGCIGTYLPVRENIAREIIENAVSACSKDYRFSPIKKSDLGNLKYEVSILSTPQLIEDIEKHDPKKHGLIVRSSEGRAGLLLPDLEGVDTADEQFEICCQKGGIDPEKDNIELYSFTVEKH
jgi:AmmeMemoRadiSam system protein A